MNVLSTIKLILGKLFAPIRLNAMFFVMMYALGVVCAYVTLPGTRNAHIYDHLYTELFVDLYVVCAILILIPRKVRLWVKGILYIILYGVAIADAYCFVKFGSTLNPSMLLLADETTGREAREFLGSYLSADVITSKVGWIFLLLLIHVIKACVVYARRRISKARRWSRHRRASAAGFAFTQAQPILGFVCVAFFIYSVMACAQNKKLTWELMTEPTIGSIEHKLTEKDQANLYIPISRLAFSVRANSLAAQDITQLIEAANSVKVDSCTYRSPNIVLIIGESFGKQHSSQYGYQMPTTPRQEWMEKTRNLVRYTDVVSPWNLTSFVFKNVFSMRVIGQEGDWCDYPLFPELFRRAGYHVTFITNQFLPQAKEAVYDFSGGFFLNNPKLSEAQFDTRNTSLHQFDDGLIADYKDLRSQTTAHNLIIFHLLGQHVKYSTRSPKGRKKFTADDYATKRPGLSKRKRQVLADYDNATLYNDSIVYAICQLFKNRDAIVIYMPDHGEECYEGDRNFFCRNHSAQIDYDLAHYEFEIPFWIWCSNVYKERHPDIFNEVVAARNRKFMIDAVPDLLLYLAGIYAPDYHAKYNILSPEYDENRPRILKGTTDYDKLRPKYEH